MKKQRLASVVLILVVLSMSLSSLQVVFAQDATMPTGKSVILDVNADRKSADSKGKGITIPEPQKRDLQKDESTLRRYYKSKNADYDKVVRQVGKENASRAMYYSERSGMDLMQILQVLMTVGMSWNMVNQTFGWNQPNYYPNQPYYYPNQPYYPSQPGYYPPSQPYYYPSQPSYYPSQPSYYPSQPYYYPSQPSYYPYPRNNNNRPYCNNNCNRNHNHNYNQPYYRNNNARNGIKKYNDYDKRVNTGTSPNVVRVPAGAVTKPNVYKTTPGFKPAYPGATYNQ